MQLITQSRVLMYRIIKKRFSWRDISPKQKYRFLYWKATEGGDFKDTKFQEYWLQDPGTRLSGRCLIIFTGFAVMAVFRLRILSSLFRINRMPYRP